MKLLLAAQIDKRKKTISKKFDDEVMSTNWDVIITFPINDQFGDIQKPDSRHIVCKAYIFISSNFLSYNNCKPN